MTDTKIDVVIIGAGVIGLACAKALAEKGLATVLIERNARIGAEISSRNSEVIHAGLYYPTTSLKARLCVQGRELLYDYCAARHIEQRRCGKLIVATTAAQEEKLSELAAQALANGVHDIRHLTRDQALAMEPALDCIAALWSPSTGIVDSHSLLLALQGDFENAGGTLALHSEFIDGEIRGDSIQLRIISGGETLALRTKILVNSAGLSACEVASRIDGIPSAAIPTPYFAKGNYFSLAGRAPFSRLVYPVPEPGGLGVHFTLDLAGQARFGPDVEWIDTIDYSVAQSRSRDFYAEIRKYWPALPQGSLISAYAGIRPKISGPGAPNTDFVIQGAETHGSAGLINLFGIESPGLTAALAIARDVADRFAT
ncbi:MAG TPA: NAD(P)/FAD-dependent oxidoreductase [Spongiibacteraceae bacterium]|nr:NAD(P)/FAD-dependent oxidoreductase [Spongiibacteraceae bacterium]